jgi:TonB-dependent SusC/RagA subfamily outer membrane receptor
MEGFLLYILKSAGISTLFLLCYVLFLKKETFFNANRVFLIAGLVLSFLIPFISIEENVWIEPIALSLNSANGMAETIPNESSTSVWLTMLSVVYVLGTTFLLIRLAVNFLSLKRIVTKGDCQREDGINFVETQNNTTPFSFFNYLIYNPETLTQSDFATIVTHEQVHIRGFHSLDILLMHTVILIQWFNPFIWLYKDNLEHNLEFIADQGALKSGSDRVGYQNLMLKTTVGATHHYFSNSFYNSIIKKRIVMLNKKKSQKSNVWKFGIVLPFLVVFVLSFQTTTVAQIKATDYGSVDKPVSIRNSSQEKPLVVIDGIIKKDVDIDNLAITPGDIKSINVLKDETATEKYGSKGKNGVVEINTKKHRGLKTKFDTPEDEPATTQVDNKNNEVAVRISSDNPPLIVIDGVEHPNTDMSNLGMAPEEIERIDVLKDDPAEKKYGTKGKNGVIEITTKKKN